MSDERFPRDLRGLSARDVWDYENGFAWFSHPSRLAKALAHFEIYKQIVPLPGDLLEFGVFKAASLLRFATFRHLLEGDHARRIVGFDAFGAFPREALSLSADRAFVERFEGAGGEGLAREEVAGLVAAKGFANVELVAGNVFDTLPAFLEANAAQRIALLHLDMDVMEPTVFALETLYPRVVPGGIIVVDDYNAVAGASDALDAFAAKHDLVPQKAPFNRTPTLLRKPAGRA
ncbi:TylF/MycF/NovP-related O-methyltransferase [Stappia sp.]|jgi:hypothetical protein|uniref:TylF/MycF/NovP-related O-methyltransferase n=1 Tax=Stappia sp. TaxID=1870903 RepID=UPI003A99641B